MNEQEAYDFIQTDNIFMHLFSGLTNTYYRAEKTTQGTRQDMNYSAFTRDLMNLKQAGKVEIKFFTQDWTRFDTFPLKADKFFGMLAICSKKEERCLLMYLVNRYEWYLYDLKAIDPNKMEFVYWKQLKTQYFQGDPEYIYEWTIFLKPSEAVLHGTYNEETMEVTVER